MKLDYMVHAWMVRIFLAFITFGWRSVNDEIVKIIKEVNAGKNNQGEFLHYQLFTFLGFTMDLEWTGRYWQVTFSGIRGRSFEVVGFSVRLHNGAWAFNSKTVAQINDKARALVLGYGDPRALEKAFAEAIKTKVWFDYLRQQFGFLDAIKNTSKSFSFPLPFQGAVFSLWEIEVINMTNGLISGFSGEIKFSFGKTMAHGVLANKFFAELPSTSIMLDNVPPGSLELRGRSSWDKLNSKAMELVDRASIKLKAA
jgi:hypothetical protein